MKENKTMKKDGELMISSYQMSRKLNDEVKKYNINKSKALEQVLRFLVKIYEFEIEVARNDYDCTHCLRTGKEVQLFCIAKPYSRYTFKRRVCEDCLKLDVNDTGVSVADYYKSKGYVLIKIEELLYVKVARFLSKRSLYKQFLRAKYYNLFEEDSGK